VYVRELKVRYRLREVAGSRLPEGSVAHPLVAAAMFSRLIGREIVEVCGLFCLSTRLDVIAYHEVARGTVDHAIVHARDVYRNVLLAHASAVMIGHNHPSGDPSPSANDVDLTRHLAAAGMLLGIPLADHLIVTTGRRYFSFKEAGQL
jgi:DNA repair protein RadC